MLICYVKKPNIDKKCIMYFKNHVLTGRKDDKKKMLLEYENSDYM